MEDLNYKRYELDKTVEELKSIGFRYDIEYQGYTYEFPVFLDDNKKPSILCKLFMNEENNNIYWGVYGTDGLIYPAYYNRQYGTTKVVKVINKNIQRELKKIGAKEIKCK